MLTMKECGERRIENRISIAAKKVMNEYIRKEEKSEKRNYDGLTV